MKKIAFFLLAAIVFTGCFKHKVRIEGDKRIEVSGRFTNPSSEDFPPISIASSGSSGNYLSYYPSEILGIGEIEASGDYSFISLNTTNSFFWVSVNHPEDDLYNENYASLNFKDSIGVRYSSFEIPEMHLPGLLEYQLILRNISNTPDSLFYKIQYKNKEQFFNIHPQTGEYLPQDQNMLQIQSVQLPDSLTSEIRLVVPEASNIIFNYKFKETGNWSENLELPANTENTSYEFQY